MTNTTPSGGVLVLLLGVLVRMAAPDVASARGLEDVLDPLGTGASVSAALGPLREAIGSQVANQIPTIAVSAASYTHDPESGVWERRSHPLGPMFAERAPTLGKTGKFRVGVAYSWIDFARFNGKDLDRLMNRVEIGELPGRGRGLAGLINDTDVATRFTVGLDLEAQVVNFTATYALHEDLDVNFLLPVVRTFARGRVREERTPDPRCLGLNEECDAYLAEFGSTLFPDRAARESAVGPGDLRLRAKYLAHEGALNVAGLIDLALPTGNTADFHGTGDTRVGVSLVLSGMLRSRVEPYLQGGVEFNADDVDRSQARYAVGATLQLLKGLAISCSFLGRSEFARQTRIPSGGFPRTARLPKIVDGVFTERPDETCCNGRPFFVDIERNDVLDLAIGLKVELPLDVVLAASAILPLNSDGLRADWVPTLLLETTF